MAEDDASLRTRQPFKAAYEHDVKWLGAAMTKPTTATTATSRS